MHLRWEAPRGVAFLPRGDLGLVGVLTAWPSATSTSVAASRVARSCLTVHAAAREASRSWLEEGQGTLGRRALPGLGGQVYSPREGLPHSCTIQGENLSSTARCARSQGPKSARGVIPFTGRSRTENGWRAAAGGVSGWAAIPGTRREPPGLCRVLYRSPPVLTQSRCLYKPVEVHTENACNGHTRSRKDFTKNFPVGAPRPDPCPSQLPVPWQRAGSQPPPRPGRQLEEGDMGPHPPRPFRPHFLLSCRILNSVLEGHLHLWRREAGSRERHPERQPGPQDLLTPSPGRRPRGGPRLLGHQRPRQNPAPSGPGWLSSPQTIRPRSLYNPPPFPRRQELLESRKVSYLRSFWDPPSWAGPLQSRGRGPRLAPPGGVAPLTRPEGGRPERSHHSQNFQSSETGRDAFTFHSRPEQEPAPINPKT